MRWRRCRGVLFLAAVLGMMVGNDARAGMVLAPRDGHRFAGSAGWLVVESEGRPEVLLDGTPVPVARAEDPIRHFRLSPLRPGGSAVTVSTRDRRTTLTLYGGAARVDLFHQDPPEACTSCHGWDRDSCTSCHTLAGPPAHEALRRGDCGRCHGTTEAPVPKKVCGACHPGFDRRHPRLRHAVSAPRDPLRPGRALDCVSCHDPHTPVSLGSQKRSERRAWCRRCHSRG